MIRTKQTISLKGLGMLLRIVAVGFSSIAAILSTVLPLFFYYPLPAFSIISTASLLVIGAILIHGLLTHTFNDLTDYKSGTDQYSPGLLSGGSRVLQTGKMSVGMLMKLGIIVTVLLLLAASLMVFFGYMKFAILTLVGVWGATSYSVKPFRFAYYPFAGEWFSLLPTMLFLGIAAPWILLDHIPIWAWQNALVNTFWCMAWVMVHHIPDRHADRKASPVKSTSVVWMEDKFGRQAAKIPALLYFIIVGALLSWIALTRPVGAIGASSLLFYSFYLMRKMDIENVEHVTHIEKLMLLFAFIIAIWLGVF